MKKHRIFKTIGAFLLCLLLMTQPLQVFAHSNPQRLTEAFTEQALEHYAGLLQITVSELVGINELLSSAFDEHHRLQMSRNFNPNGPTEIRVSENLVAVFEMTSTRRPVQRLGRDVWLWEDLFTDTIEFRNNFGFTIVSLTSWGIFLVNSHFQVRAHSAFGTHSGTFWSISHGTPSMSNITASTAWVQNSFQGSFNLGFDPISIQIQSFNYSNIITATPHGTATSRWV